MTEVVIIIGSSVREHIICSKLNNQKCIILSDFLNPKLKIQGILRTMYDPRNSLTNAVSLQLREHFGSKVYRSSIPRNVRLAEAPSHGLPAYLYDKNSKGSLAYLALAGEILKKEKMVVND